MPERWDEFKVSSTERQVVRALGSIGSATLVSRVVGFVRDIVVALVFGAGPVTDAFFVAFRIPNILRRLLAEGALSTAMIPVFSEYFVTRSWPEVLRMLRAVLALALVALGVTALLGIATAPWLVTAIAPGIAEDPARGGLAVLLTRVMFPYVVLVGLAALAAGALNAQGRFFASALGPAVQNVGMILAISLLASRVDPPILSLAIGVLLGGTEPSAKRDTALRQTVLLSGGDVISASPVVARRREAGPLALDFQLALVVLAADLGAGLLVLVALGDVRRRWLVGRRGHLVRVVVVEPGLDPLLLGQAGQLVVIEPLQLAGMVTAVAVELLRRLVWVLLCHDATVAPARPAAGVGSVSWPWHDELSSCSPPTTSRTWSCCTRSTGCARRTQR